MELLLCRVRVQDEFRVLASGFLEGLGFRICLGSG